MTDKDLAEALGRGPSIPADAEEIDTAVPIEKKPADDGDGDVSTEGRGPG